jgi:hypothetical protein
VGVSATRGAKRLPRRLSGLERLSPADAHPRQQKAVEEPLPREGARPRAP